MVSTRAKRRIGAALLALAIFAHGRTAAADDDVTLDRWKAFMPLFGTGTAAFLVAYTPVLVAGSPAIFRTTESLFFSGGDNGGLQLLVPIAGPFLYAANHPHDSTINSNGSDVSPTMRTLLVVDGIAQAGGAALMLVGLLAGHREADDHADRIDHTARAPRSRFFTLTPMITPTTAGVSATITAF